MTAYSALSAAENLLFGLILIFVFNTDDSLQWPKGVEPAGKSRPVRWIAVKERKRYLRHISQTIEWHEEVCVIQKYKEYKPTTARKFGQCNF